MEQKKTNKSLPIIIIIAVILLIVAFLVFRGSPEKRAEKQAAKIAATVDDDMIKQVSDQVNTMCPMTVDEHTRLDNTEAKPGKVLQYNYTLTQLSKAELPETFEATMTDQILAQVKHNPQMGVLRDAKVTFVYSYKDVNGDLVKEFKVTPDMYE